MKEVYNDLIDRWIDGSGRGFGLKTDLYDEAVSSHGLVPLLNLKCESVIGIDVSPDVVMAAKERLDKEWHKKYNVAVSDVRHIALKSESFDYILSNSTLDHFQHSKDMILSLRELCRILKPGGIFVITLDNPSNPLIYLRNILPYWSLKLCRLVPFYMGVTVTERQLINQLKYTGFTVCDSTIIAHCPRIFAIWVGCILNKIGSERMKICSLKLMKMFKCLESFPMRNITGYFIAVKAVK